MENKELILVRITGEDKPGLTASVTAILAQYDASILDIGQADIHNTLSLGILFATDDKDAGYIMKKLLFNATKLGVTINFYPVSKKEYAEWVGMQGKNRYILTLLGRRLSAEQITSVTSVIAKQELNIDAIRRLSGRVAIENFNFPKRRSCIEFSLRGNPQNRKEMHS